MSKRDWRTPTIFALTGLLCLGPILYAVWHTGYSQAEKRVSRQQSAEHHIQYAEDRIDETCTQADRASLLKCVHDEIKSAQDHGRAKSDLDAQMAMALWAKIMTISGIAGSVLAGGGLYLVWRTLEATGDAVEAANTSNEIMRQEQRPWVTLEKDFHCHFHDTGGYQGTLAWNYNLRNKGKTPAYAITGHSKIIKGDSYFDTWNQIEEFKEDCVKKTSAGQVPIIFPNEATNNVRFRTSFNQTYNMSRDANGVVTKNVVKGEHFSFIFCITYRLGLDPDSQVGVEARAFAIEDRVRYIGPWHHRLREFSFVRIVN